jgi:hypothetical protein
MLTSLLINDLKKYFHHHNFRTKEQKEAVRNAMILNQLYMERCNYAIFVPRCSKNILGNLADHLNQFFSFHIYFIR